MPATDTTPFTYAQAKRAARWIAEYVRGAHFVSIVEDVKTGETHVTYLNGCNMKRSCANHAEFIELREMAAQS